MNISTAAERGIWIASLAWALWTVEPLETFCRHVVQAVPFSFQCSRSALPPVICTLSSQQSTCWQGLNVRGVTTAAAAGSGALPAYWVAALLMEGSLISDIVGANRHASYKNKVLSRTQCGAQSLKLSLWGTTMKHIPAWRHETFRTGACEKKTAQIFLILIVILYFMLSRSGLVGPHALQGTAGISVLNFNLFLAVSSGAHTWCYNYIWAIGSAVFHLGWTGHTFTVAGPLCNSRLTWIQGCHVITW